MFADEARIRKQIASAVTDSGAAANRVGVYAERSRSTGAMSPGVSNLFQLLEASGRVEAHASLLTDYEQGTLKYSELKQAVADGLVAISAGIQENLAELKKDRKAVKNQIKQSSFEIRKRAQETVKEVKDICGLMNVRM